MSIHALDPDHYNILRQAIGNILSTEIAENTMAQLVDGLPVRDVAYAARGSLVRKEHPITSHVTLCGNALDQTRLFRESFDPDLLNFRTNVSTLCQLNRGHLLI